MARLPGIDPNTRTLLICGYPNVGKSSFMNKLTRAQVDVQPYAFTTKSLFVGHMDYRYLRWQVSKNRAPARFALDRSTEYLTRSPPRSLRLVLASASLRLRLVQVIDTPGILDHPLEERNTIEMQSITALAHLRACILYFIDPSEQCGYTVPQQIALYKSIRPLFANKPAVLVLSKTDAKDPNTLPAEQLAEIEKISQEDGMEILKLSCYTETGVMEARNFACDKLLAVRVEQKLKSSKVAEHMNRLHLAQPQPRDDRERPAFIPEEAKNRVKYDKEDPERRRVERDLEVEGGGAGVFNVDLKSEFGSEAGATSRNDQDRQRTNDSLFARARAARARRAEHYQLADDEWKYDSIPEIMDGHNVADFFDPDILERLDALEAEEERLEQAGFYDEADYELNSDEEEVLETAKKIRSKKELMRKESSLRKTRNGPTISRVAKANSKKRELGRELSSLGIEVERGRSRSVARSAASRKQDEDAMDLDTPRTRSLSKPRSASQAARPRSAIREPSTMGLRDDKMVAKAKKLKAKAETKRSLHGRKGESDRHVAVKLPKHLFTGKRGIGKNERR